MEVMANVQSPNNEDGFMSVRLAQGERPDSATARAPAKALDRAGIASVCDGELCDSHQIKSQHNVMGLKDDETTCRR